MPSEMLQHSLPGIFGAFGIVNLRTRIIEESMFGVIADDFDGQAVFLRRLFQTVYFLRIDPCVALPGDEQRRHFQLLQNIFFRNITIEWSGRLEFRHLARGAERKRAAHAESIDRETTDPVCLFRSVHATADYFHPVLSA